MKLGLVAQELCEVKEEAGGSLTCLAQILREEESENYELDPVEPRL